MAQAARDQNRVPTLIGVDEATGLVPTAVEVSTGGEMLVKLSSDLEIGAVEIKNAASDVRALVVAATSDADPDLDGTNLLGVHSLLSARKDATTTVGLTAEDSTHNALHVAISDGEGIANVDASNQLLVVDEPLAVLVGEVQATPTANTVLARLKTIGDGQLADGHNVTVDNAVGSGVYVRPGTSAVFTIKDDKGTTAGTSTGITVGSSSTTVLASNSARKEAIIVNDSDEVAYLKYGTTAVLNSGIRLNANGGTLVETVYTGIITGICASGSKVVTVTEV